jgi:hypothetical protein
LIECYAISGTCTASLGCVFEHIHSHRQALRLLGLALLAAGLAVALAFDAVAGLVLVVAAAITLALGQPLILARVRSRSVRKVVSSNGHSPATDVEDLDVRD